MKIEVKIQCDCGTRYKFDVQPLNGRMPQKVSCPGCGVDGTPAANAFLREKLQPATSGMVSPQRGRFALGIAGAVVAGLAATGAWNLLIRLTGHQLGFGAWGVGLLIGLGARGFSGGGNRRLGVVAGACAFLAILGGQFLASESSAGGLKSVFASGGFGWLTLLWLLMAVLSAFTLGAGRVRAN